MSGLTDVVKTAFAVLYVVLACVCAAVAVGLVLAVLFVIDFIRSIGGVS